MDAADERVDADARARVVLPSLDYFEALVCILAMDGWSANRIAKELQTSRAEIVRILMRVAVMLRTGEVVTRSEYDESTQVLD